VLETGFGISRATVQSQTRQAVAPHRTDLSAIRNIAPVFD
jgi:hypothetical protein